MSTNKSSLKQKRLTLSNQTPFIKRVAQKIFKPYNKVLKDEIRKMIYVAFKDEMNFSEEDKYSCMSQYGTIIEQIEGPYGMIEKKSTNCPPIEAVSQDDIVIIPSNGLNVNYNGVVQMYDENFYFVFMDIKTTNNNEMKDSSRLSANGYLVDEKERIKEFEEDAQTILTDPYSIANYVTNYFDKKKTQCLEKGKKQQSEQMGQNE